MVAPVRDKVIKAPSWPRLRPAGLNTIAHTRARSPLYTYILLLWRATEAAHQWCLKYRHILSRKNDTYILIVIRHRFNIAIRIYIYAYGKIFKSTHPGLIQDSHCGRLVSEPPGLWLLLRWLLVDDGRE